MFVHRDGSMGATRRSSANRCPSVVERGEELPVMLAEPGHTRRFWELVRRHAPEADAARAWLREHHGELLAALDD